MSEATGVNTQLNRAPNITTPTVNRVANSTSELIITATATDEDAGDTLTYKLLRGTSADNITELTLIPTNISGRTVTFKDMGLSMNTTYYYNIKVSDGIDNKTSDNYGSDRTYCKGSSCSGVSYTYPKCTASGCSSGKKTCSNCNGEGTKTTSEQCSNCSGQGSTGCAGKITKVTYEMVTYGSSKSCPICGTRIASGTKYPEATVGCNICSWRKNYLAVVCCSTSCTRTYLINRGYLDCVCPNSSTCSLCNGAGNWSVESQCGTCNGTGKINCTTCKGARNGY